MQWQLEKYAVEEFVKLLRRIFRYKNEFSNEDIEIIQFNSGSSQLVFEQFFEENEKYPIITVYGMGGSYLNNGLDDYEASSIDASSYVLGTVARDYRTVSAGSPLVAKLPWNEEIKSAQITGFFLNYLWDGEDIGGDDLTYDLYYASPSGSITVASGSILGTLSRTSITQYAYFNSPVIINGSNYYLSVSAPTGSSYSLLIDPDCGLTYSIGGVPYSGSVVGSLVQPPSHALGGRLESTIMIRVITKNSTAAMRNLSEILITRFLLLKQAQYNRSSTTEQMVPVVTNDVVSEWLSKGIVIRGIREGSPEMRKRGINDLIFTLPISVDILTNWSIEYPGEFLEGFNVETSVFV